MNSTCPFDSNHEDISAFEYRFLSEYMEVKVQVFKVGADEWNETTSVDLKILPDDSNYSPPIIRSCSAPFSSMEEALDVARTNLEAIAINGLTANGGRTWEKAWKRLDAWGFNIGRQLELQV